MINNSDVKIIKAWKIPYPGCDTSQIRDKEFRIVRLKNNNLAFCKLDSDPKYLAHEADILSVLNDLECVPLLMHQTPTAIFTTYIKGKLLPEVMKNLKISACLKVGWQILMIVNKIHKKGIVHGDIRPWNFMLDEKHQLFLFDFEYAYERNKVYTGKTACCLSRHHGQYLIHPITEWCETFQCISDVWHMSNYWVIREVLVYVALLMKFIVRFFQIVSYRLKFIRLISLNTNESQNGSNNI